MLKRLLVLALALAGGWVAYRRLTAPPAPSATFDAPLTPAPAARPLAAEPPAAEPPPAEEPRTGVLQTPVAGDEAQLDAYCMRCKEHRAIQHMRIEITPGGRRAAKGICPVCGAKLNRFLPSLD